MRILLDHRHLAIMPDDTLSDVLNFVVNHLPCRGIERWMSLGLDTLLLMLGAGNTTHAQVMRALDLLGDKVIPRFKAS